MTRYRVDLTSTAPAPPPNPANLRREFFGPDIPKREEFRTHLGKLLDLQRIDRAIRSANHGFMRPITDLAREAMHIDGHGSSLLQKRFNRLAALPWEVTAASGPNVDEQRSEDYAAFVRAQLEQVPNFCDRIIDVAWAHFDGRACSEIEWMVRGAEWHVKDLHWIHPRRLSFGQNRDLLVVDTFRNTGHFRDDEGFAVESVPYKFVTYRPRMFGDYPEREGLAPRLMYWSWFQRFGMRERLALIELFGKPWRIVKPMKGAGHNEESLKDAFEVINNLGYLSTARMPPGVEVQIEQPASGAGQLHAENNEEARLIMSKLVLGSTGTTDAVSTGLGSSIGDAHLSEEDLIIATDARRVSESLEDLLTDAIIAVNFGVDALSHAPKFNIETKPPQDAEKDMQRLTNAVKAGVPVALEEARDISRVREIRDDEPFIAMVQRETQLGQPAPAPAPEIVYPVGAAPVPGEVAAPPAEAINLPGGNEPPPGTPPAPGVPPGPQTPPAPPGAPPAPGTPPPSDGPPLAASEPPLDDEDIARLAQKMTELKIERCEHGHSNRCRICGIERVRDFEMINGETVWAVKWRPIPKEPPQALPVTPMTSAQRNSLMPLVRRMNPWLDQFALNELATAPDDVLRNLAAGQPAEGPIRVPLAVVRTLPFAGFEDFDACLAAQQRAGHDEEAARAICGKLQAQLESSKKLQAQPSAEGGMHMHGLERENGKTALGGAHEHVYDIDGALVFTEADGIHQHDIAGGDEDFRNHTKWDGVHFHRIAVGGLGTDTEIGGDHEHQLGVAFTALDGLHEHELKLPDGRVVQSLTPGEFLEITEPDPAFADDPRKRKRRNYGQAADTALLFNASMAGGLPSQHVCLAAQPESTFGSPEQLVERGTNAGAVATGKFADALADAVDGKTDPKKIRAAIDAAAKKFDEGIIAEPIERELLQGGMLGALDVTFEAAEETELRPESFADWQESLLLAHRENERLGWWLREFEDTKFAARPLTEAIKSFLARNVLTRDEFDKLTAAAQRRAFTVAGAANREMVRTVKRELLRQLAVGADLREFKRFTKKRLESAGWTPANKSHVQTVFRTNVVNAYNGGRVRQMTQPAVLEARPFWQILTVNDGAPRQRPTHQAVHGLILAADDPFWQQAFPPFGYNCRCRVRNLGPSRAAAGIVRGSSISGLPDPGFASGRPTLL